MCKQQKNKNEGKCCKITNKIECCVFKDHNKWKIVDPLSKFSNYFSLLFLFYWCVQAEKKKEK